jgi:hypothetical protein
MTPSVTSLVEKEAPSDALRPVVEEYIYTGKYLYPPSLAYEFNYFDQMHLVKDFKKYLNISPGAFFPENFAL